MRDAVSDLIAAGRDREAAIEGVRASTGHASGTAVPAPPSTSTSGGPMDPVTQFQHLGGPLGAVVAGISTDDLDRPTPCAEFTVRGVLEHMIQGATAFAAAYRGTEPATPDVSDPPAALGDALGELVAAVSAPGALDQTIVGPFGEVPGDTFARFIVLDGLVHGWDLATATGQSYEPPAELVAEVEAFARTAVDGLRGGTAFGPACEPPPGATAIERVVAYTGRAVVTA